MNPNIFPDIELQLEGKLQFLKSMTVFDHIESLNFWNGITFLGGRSGDSTKRHSDEEDYIYLVHRYCLSQLGDKLSMHKYTSTFL